MIIYVIIILIIVILFFNLNSNKEHFAKCSGNVATKNYCNPSSAWKPNSSWKTSSWVPSVIDNKQLLDSKWVPNQRWIPNPSWSPSNKWVPNVNWNPPISWEHYNKWNNYRNKNRNILTKKCTSVPNTETVITPIPNSNSNISCNFINECSPLGGWVPSSLWTPTSITWSPPNGYVPPESWNPTTDWVPPCGWIPPSNWVPPSNWNLPNNWKLLENPYIKDKIVTDATPDPISNTIIYLTENKELDINLLLTDNITIINDSENIYTVKIIHSGNILKFVTNFNQIILGNNIILDGNGVLIDFNNLLNYNSFIVYKKNTKNINIKNFTISNLNNTCLCNIDYSLSTIKNIDIKAITINLCKCDNKDKFGFILSNITNYNMNINITNCIISSSQINNSRNCSFILGGGIEPTNNIIISNCNIFGNLDDEKFNNKILNSEYCGGIIGSSSGGNIIICNCIVTLYIENSNNIGGAISVNLDNNIPTILDITNCIFIVDGNNTFKYYNKNTSPPYTESSYTSSSYNYATINAKNITKNKFYLSMINDYNIVPKYYINNIYIISNLTYKWYTGISTTKNGLNSSITSTTTINSTSWNSSEINNYLLFKKSDVENILNTNDRYLITNDNTEIDWNTFSYPITLSIEDNIWYTESIPYNVN